MSTAELDFSLYEVIDPDALEQLDSRLDGEWQLTFEAKGHEVIVDSDDDINVDGTQYQVNQESSRDSRSD